MLIYLTGVTAGSLTVAIADPHVYLAGASGGVYALIAAHLANVVFNWREMEYPGLRLIGFIIIAGVDTGVAVYYRYTGQVCRYTYIYISTGCSKTSCKFLRLVTQSFFGFFGFLSIASFITMQI